MHQFLWKIAGGDLFLLAQVNKKTRIIFTLSGILVLLVFLLSLIGFLQIFYLVFTNTSIAITLSIFLTLLFLTIYRLCMVTLESDAREYTISYYFSFFIRLLFISLLGLVISKGCEYFFFAEILGDEKLLAIKGKLIIAVETLHLNIVTWILTVIFLSIILSPFFLKFSIGPSSTYSVLNKETVVDIVVDDYQDFKRRYNKIFLETYGLDITINEPFLDPPFNTQPKTDSRKFGDNKDFLKLFQGEKNT